MQTLVENRYKYILEVLLKACQVC